MSEPKVLRLQGKVAAIYTVVGKTRGLSLATDRIGELRGVCEKAVASVLGEEFYVSEVTSVCMPLTWRPGLPPRNKLIIQASIKCRIQFMERSWYRRIQWAGLRDRVLASVKEIYDGDVAVASSYGNSDLEGSGFDFSGVITESD